MVQASTDQPNLVELYHLRESGRFGGKLKIEITIENLCLNLMRLSFAAQSQCELDLWGGLQHLAAGHIAIVGHPELLQVSL